LPFINTFCNSTMTALAVRVEIVAVAKSAISCLSNSQPPAFAVDQPSSANSPAMQARCRGVAGRKMPARARGERGALGGSVRPLS
jgi:hypothetical protein